MFSHPLCLCMDIIQCACRFSLLTTGHHAQVCRCACTVSVDRAEKKKNPLHDLLKQNPKATRTSLQTVQTRREKGISFSHLIAKRAKQDDLCQEPVRRGEIQAAVVDITSRVTSSPSLPHPCPSSLPPPQWKLRFGGSCSLSGVGFLSLCTCPTLSAWVGNVRLLFCFFCSFSPSRALLCEQRSEKQTRLYSAAFVKRHASLLRLQVRGKPGPCRTTPACANVTENLPGGGSGCALLLDQSRLSSV